MSSAATAIGQRGTPVPLGACWNSTQGLRDQIQRQANTTWHPCSQLSCTARCPPLTLTPRPCVRAVTHHTFCLRVRGHVCEASEGGGTLAQAVQILHVEHSQSLRSMAVHVEAECLLRVEPAPATHPPHLHTRIEFRRGAHITVMIVCPHDTPAAVCKTHLAFTQHRTISCHDAGSSMDSVGSTCSAW